MNKVTKNLLLGYVFIALLGLGCFGFIFMNFLSDMNAVVSVTCTTSLLLLIVYLVVAVIQIRKRSSQEVWNVKQSSPIFIILSLVTIIMSVVFFLFRSSITMFLAEELRVFKATISILFVISMVIVVLILFRGRK